MPALGTTYAKGHYTSGVGKTSKTRDPKCSKAMSDWKTSGTLTHDVAVVLARCRSQAKGLRGGAKPDAKSEARFASQIEARAQRVALSYGPSHAKVVYISDPEEIKSGFKRMTGHEYTDEKLASLVGATNDSTVSVTGYSDGAIYASIASSKYNADRMISEDYDGLYIKNNGFFVKKEHQGKGIGSEVLHRQIEYAQRLGIKGIKTIAARFDPRSSDEEDLKENGYYTWPRLGYDAHIPYRVKDFLPESMKKYKMISEMMRTQEGRDLWKKHGGTTTMTFDLTPGSTSMHIHNAYISERLKSGKSKKQG